MDKCKKCLHYGKDCLPHLLTLNSVQVAEWCKIRRNALHMSVEELAKQSGVPQSTLERALSHKGVDCYFSTLQPVLRVLTGCTDDELQCRNPSGQSESSLIATIHYKDNAIRHLEEENRRQAEYINQLQIMAKEDIERAKKEEAESLDFLKRQNRQNARIICTLSIALGITLLIIIAALVIDKLNGDIGFFWLNGMFPHGETIKELLKASL